MSDQWEYRVSGYYGPGGRAGTPRNPNRGRLGELEGDRAGEVGCNGASAMQTEVAAFKSRDDIAEIVVVGPTGGHTFFRTEEGWTE